MKVKIGPYRYRWISEIHTRYMKKKYGFDYPKTQTRFETLLEKVEDCLQWVYNHSINLILDNRAERKVSIRIDNWDVWSMDHTLSLIILPMLKKLKGSKQGSPFVDDEDVPEHLKKANAKPIEDPYELDEHFHARWDYVLDEMIFAFEMNCKSDWEMDFYGPFIKEGNGPRGHFEWVDDEGLKECRKRIENGNRLFGKYFSSLWS